MKKNNKTIYLIINLLFLFLINILFPLPSFAMTYFYVDSDCSESGATGQSGNPWQYMGQAWSTVNAALASDDVTIYFSAREAGSDTSDKYYRYSDPENPRGIDLENRTDTSNHTLIFDGRTKYNTNDSSPSWLDYSGSSMAIVNNFNSQNSSHAKISRVTIDGFNIYQELSQKAISISGDHWTVKNCDISSAPTGSMSPLILIVPTADAAHEGSGYYAPPLTNITLDNNIIHDSDGEMLYVGGGGSASGGSTPPGSESWASAGYPAHQNITITNNKFYNGGIYGGQGDAIDVKGGIKNLFISGNEIYNMSDSGTRAIVLQGWQADDTTTDQNIVIENNYIHDATNWAEAISLSNSWGVSQGVTIRNNIIDTVESEGIRIYQPAGGNSSKWINIYNNTIYNASYYGIHITSNNSVTIINNLLIGNNSGGNQVNFSATITEHNNAYSDTFGETCTNCQTVTLSDVIDSFGGNFILTEDSNAIDNGSTIAGFSTDYEGTTRIEPWDIGAYEYDNIPSPPTNLLNQ